MNRKKKKNRLYHGLQLPVSQGLEGRRFFSGEFMGGDSSCYLGHDPEGNMVAYSFTCSIVNSFPHL